jgi:hypothetical protein
MTLPFRDAWLELRSGSPTPNAGGFRLRLLDAGATVRVYAAVGEPSLAPAVLIELPAEAGSHRPGQLSSRAFTVQSADFPGLAAGRTGVMVALRDPHYEDLFALLAEEVGLTALAATSAVEAVAALGRVIDRWRRFVERGRAPLSEERIRGLIGELVVLTRLLRKLDTRRALLAWKGPQDALRDFELPNESVEVKSFQSDTGASVRINDPQQLDAVATRPVYLVAVQLAKATVSGRSLPLLVDHIASLVASDPDGPDLLEHQLADYGYLPAHATMYPDRFMVERVVAFRVAEGFPRIQASTVPAGVRDVHFSIELAALKPFLVDVDELLGDPSPTLELGT